MDILPAVGAGYAVVTAPVNVHRLRFFQFAIGGSTPSAAGDAGIDSSEIPPTYLFCLEMLHANNPFAFVEEFGISPTQILHAGQSFVYHAPVRIGDELTFRGRVVDIAEKKNGRLLLVTQEVRVDNQLGQTVATISRTLALKRAEQDND